MQILVMPTSRIGYLLNVHLKVNMKCKNIYLEPIIVVSLKNAKHLFLQ